MALICNNTTAAADLVTSGGWPWPEAIGNKQAAQEMPSDHRSGSCAAAQSYMEAVHGRAGLGAAGLTWGSPRDAASRMFQPQQWQ